MTTDVYPTPWQPPPDIRTPAYVADMARLRRNLEILAAVKARTGCKILLATKAFAMPAIFPLMRDVLDGTTASGLFEAQLGHDAFGREIHVYSPAYTPAEMQALSRIAGHFYFNSASQLEQFYPLLPAGAHVGIRVNPEMSQVKNNPIYDPCHPGSRFGVKAADLPSLPWERIDVLHVHALCENGHAESVNLIHGVSDKFAPYLSQVSAVNFGGGHFITHPDYDIQPLIDAINRFQERHGVQVILEPGGAVVLNAGYLVARVLDIPEKAGASQIAVLDTSATCHMPDVLEVPYTPSIQGSLAGSPGEAIQATPQYPCLYTLGGKTCLTGDIIGSYAFPTPLQPGDLLVFEDMMQYSFVKNTTFNGVPLPDLAVLHEDGRYEVVKQFSYLDFYNRLG